MPAPQHEPLPEHEPEPEAAAAPVAPLAAAPAAVPTPAPTPVAPAPAAAAEAPVAPAPAPPAPSRPAPPAGGLRGNAPTKFSDRLRPRAAPPPAAAQERDDEPEDDYSPPHMGEEPPPWLDVPPPGDEDMAAGPPMLDDDLLPDDYPGHSGSGSNGNNNGGNGNGGAYASTAGDDVPVLLTPLGERWYALVPQLAITALTRELALQAECIAIDEQAQPPRWVLKVERESLRQPALKDKLQAAMAQQLGVDVVLDIETGRASDSPALRDTMAARARQRRAESIILEDPEVQQLLAQFRTARILPGSIKPI